MNKTNDTAAQLRKARRNLEGYLRARESIRAAIDPTSKPDKALAAEIAEQIAAIDAALAMISGRRK